jgi:hypothetical protein
MPNPLPELSFPSDPPRDHSHRDDLVTGSSMDLLGDCGVT